MSGAERALESCLLADRHVEGRQGETSGLGLEGRLVRERLEVKQMLDKAESILGLAHLADIR